MLSIISTILTTLAPILEKLIPDPTLRATTQLELQKALIEQGASMANAMKDVMVADAASESWMTRNARPCTVFWSLSMMTWLCIAPIFGLADETINVLKNIPADLWNVCLVGIGGYTLAKTVTDGIKAVKK